MIRKGQHNKQYKCFVQTINTYYTKKEEEGVAATNGFFSSVCKQIHFCRKPSHSTSWYSPLGKLVLGS